MVTLAVVSFYNCQRSLLWCLHQRLSKDFLAMDWRVKVGWGGFPGDKFGL